ncbi:MAG: phosphatase PAP2 family protein [Rhizobiaceae bacterium]
MKPPQLDSETITHPSSPSAMADGEETARVAIIAAWGVLIATVIFTTMPAIDLAVSRYFLGENGRFILADSDFWKTFRTITLRGFAFWYVAILVCGFWTWKSRKPILGLNWLKFMYLALCTIAGPLLLTNVLLKEHWGRWRPREVTNLGGTEEFTSPLDLSGTCADNCSFVSGEVSSMVMLFISLAFVSTRLRPLFYGLTIVMGAFSAVLRVGQGGHFLSDTLFAAALMVLIAAGLYWLIFLGKNPVASETEVNWKRLIPGR